MRFHWHLIHISCDWQEIKSHRSTSHKKTIKIKCVCVCVRAHARACGAVAQLVRMRLENGNIWDLAGFPVQVTVMASYSIISLGKKLTHNCLSRLRSINEYLVSDWSGKGLRLQQSPSATGVRMGLWVPTPQLALQSVLL